MLMRKSHKRPWLLDDRWVQTILCCGTVLLLLAFVILRYEGFFAMLHSLLRTLRPLLLGILFASILHRPFCRFQSDLHRLAGVMRLHPSEKQIRGLAIGATVAMTLLIVVGIVCIILPQLSGSVRLLSENFTFYRENLIAWLHSHRFSVILDWFSGQRMTRITQALQTYLPTVLAKTYDYTANLLSAVLDIGIGAVFSVYLLADAKRLKQQASQIAIRVCGQTKAHLLARGIRLICTTFARFFSSQLTEALILGSLCYVGMLLFHFPFPVLISVLIGITNIIPYVGPVVGTIPCAVILLLVKPDCAFWFVLFIIILQQLESNVIYPRIVGHSIGLPPAWVLSAIVIGGGLWGIAGLLFGIPLTAVLYTLLFGEKSFDSPPNGQSSE